MYEDIQFINKLVNGKYKRISSSYAILALGFDSIQFDSTRLVSRPNAETRSNTHLHPPTQAQHIFPM